MNIHIRRVLMTRHDEARRGHDDRRDGRSPPRYGHERDRCVLLEPLYYLSTTSLLPLYCLSTTSSHTVLMTWQATLVANSDKALQQLLTTFGAEAHTVHAHSPLHFVHSSLIVVCASLCGLCLVQVWRV